MNSIVGNGISVRVITSAFADGGIRANTGAMLMAVSVDKMFVADQPLIFSRKLHLHGKLHATAFS